MTQPTVSNTRAVDPVLTNFAITFKPTDLIGEEVAPNVKVEERTGTIFKLTRDFALRIGGDTLQRAEAGAYHRAGYSWGTTTYATKEYGVEYPSPAVVRASSQVPVDLQRKATEMGAKDLMLEQERQIATEALETDGKWASDTTLSGTSQWDDYANSNPVSDIDSRRESILQNTGAEPNTMYMGLQVWNKLKEHPLLTDKFKHVQRGILSTELVANVFEVPKLLVGRAVRNSAVQGATFSSSFMWTKHVTLEVKEAPSTESRIGIVNLVWDEGGVGFPRATETYDEPQTRSLIIRTFAHWQALIVESNYGQRIKNAVS